MRSNSSESEVGSHWNSNATTVSTAAMTRPVATSWTIPLRTEGETTPSPEGRAKRGVRQRVANVRVVKQGLARALVPVLLVAVVIVASTRASTSEQRPVVLAFAGDVHFEGAVRATLLSRSGEVLGPIASVLGQADLAIVNLETAVTTRGVAQPKQYVFRAPPSAFAALRNGGVDVASMANNHGMDYGVEGLRDSLAAARMARFPVIGIGLDDSQAYRPFRARLNGQRIAIIAATQVLDDNLISSWTAGPDKPGLASAKNVPRLLEAVRAG